MASRERGGLVTASSGSRTAPGACRAGGGRGASRRGGSGRGSPRRRSRAGGRARAPEPARAVRRPRAASMRRAGARARRRRLRPLARGCGSTRSAGDACGRGARRAGRRWATALGGRSRARGAAAEAEARTRASLAVGAPRALSPRRAASRRCARSCFHSRPARARRASAFARAPRMTRPRIDQTRGACIERGGQRRRRAERPARTRGRASAAYVERRSPRGAGPSRTAREREPMGVVSWRWNARRPRRGGGAADGASRHGDDARRLEAASRGDRVARRRGGVGAGGGGGVERAGGGRLRGPGRTRRHRRRPSVARGARGGAGRR